MLPKVALKKFVEGVSGAPAAAQALNCPHCRLVLMVEQVENGASLSYDPAGWGRHCANPGLDSPVLCLLQRNGANGSGGHP